MCKLTVNVGPMFSGKTTALQQQGTKHLTAKQNVVFLKPEIDSRYSYDKIVSHDGISVEAINVTDTILIKEVMAADIVLIDEVQFLSLSVINEIVQLLELGKTIYCSGLDLDHLMQGFEVTMKLMAIANKVNKFAAICEYCGKEATITGKKYNNENIIELGSSDVYYPLCRSCYLTINKQRG